jgi:hypothetical protein
MEYKVSRTAGRVPERHQEPDESEMSQAEKCSGEKADSSQQPASGREPKSPSPEISGKKKKSPHRAQDGMKVLKPESAVAKKGSRDRHRPEEQHREKCGCRRESCQRARIRRK